MLNKLLNFHSKLLQLLFIITLPQVIYHIIMSQCHDDQSLDQYTELVWYGDMGIAIRTTVCTGKKVKHLQEIILVSRGG